MAFAAAELFAHPEPYIGSLRFFGHLHRIEQGRRGGAAAVLHSQRRNLTNLLRFAKARSPFYAERLKGIDPERADLRAIAPVDKSELMAQFDRVATDPLLRFDECEQFVRDPAQIGRLFAGRYVLAHTSGSTGKRGIFACDRFAWEMAQALGFAMPFGEPQHLARMAASPVRKLRVAAIIPTGGHYTSYLLPAITSGLRDVFTRMEFSDILDPFDKIIARLNAQQPEIVHSYPSMLDALAWHRQHGDLKISPFILMGASEPFPWALKQRLRAIFPGSYLIEVYAATELPSIAHSCAHGRLHLAADWLVLENVDGAGRPVPPGEQGEKVYATNLFNFMQPLIRYELSDAIRFPTEECPCGCPLPVIEVSGRSNDTLWVKDPAGKLVTLLATPILVAFMDVPGLRQYQLVQETPSRIHINYVVDRAGTEEKVRRDIERVFQDYLSRHGLAHAVTLTYAVASEILRDPRTHKVLQVIRRLSESKE